MDRLKQPSWDVVARVHPGTTAEQAQSELALIAGRLAQGDRELEGIVPRVQTFAAEDAQFAFRSSLVQRASLAGRR